MTAKNFKDMRRKKGFSQAELAQEFGVDVMTISRWERGVVSPIPRLAELALVSLKPRPKTKKGS
jgi:transcriptional regulator with XRE-family HTH domain